MANSSGLTPLMTAAFWGHTEIMKLLLQKGADIKKKGPNGTTALGLVCRDIELGIQEAVRSAKLLLENGAPTDAQDDDGDSSLIAAAGNGRHELVELLLAYGASMDIVNKNELTALVAAASKGHAEEVRLLLETGTKAGAESSSPYTETALFVASSGGHFAAVRNLLDHGARVDWVYVDGNSPLMAASLCGHTEVASLLLERGAPLIWQMTTAEQR